MERSVNGGQYTVVETAAVSSHMETQLLLSDTRQYTFSPYTAADQTYMVVFQLAIDPIYESKAKKIEMLSPAKV